MSDTICMSEQDKLQADLIYALDYVQDQIKIRKIDNKIKVL